ncbi:Spy/CpxP family protein refolding chaperone [Polaribacter sargassicola]|uniref:Spy/CpxP family protein refolding chaperone n=1 Tax=Polaribacter sargassicola TaxID=2836891 RepID=UPI001F365368|nr:hypothetical protein [Polaribacter sp. DS7-9]MCG1035478.1 hypothetical protein [Polaribacter sp. DS7-9]
MKSKLLPILLIFLVLLNGFLIFMIIKKPHESKRAFKERTFLPEQLNFSETQTEQFKKLDKEHRSLMMSLDKTIMSQKDVLFNSFQQENFNIDSLTNKIGLLEAKKESEVFNFFKKVRTICTEEQAIKIDKLIKQAIRGVGGEGGPRQEGQRMPPPREGGMQPPNEGMPPPR